MCLYTAYLFTRGCLPRDLAKTMGLEKTMDLTPLDNTEE